MTTPALTFRDLTLGYDRHPAVHHITGEVKRGELLAIVGPNGAGKSTLLKGIIGELTPLGGSRSTCDGLNRNPTSPICRSRSTSTAVSRSRCSTAWRWGCGARSGSGAASTASATTSRGPGAGDGRAARLSRTARSARSPAASSSACCSPGCCCRTRALILLDEPFRAVDTKTVADLIALILRWHGEGRTVIAALHDIEQVRAHFPHDAAARPRGGGLGRHPQGADAGQSRQVAAAGRGVRRAC